MKSQQNDEAPKWIVNFYNCLWSVLKVILVIGLIAAILFIRVAIDKAYYNWLIK